MNLFVCLSVVEWLPPVHTITFEGVTATQLNLIGVFYMYFWY